MTAATGEALLTDDQRAILIATWQKARRAVSAAARDLESAATGREWNADSFAQDGSSSSQNVRCAHDSSQASGLTGLGVSARLYVSSIIGLGALAVLLAIPRLAEQDVPLFATLAILSLITSFAKVNLPVPRSASTLTVCYVVDFTTLLLLGWPAATLTAAIGAWSQCTFRCRHESPAYQTAFSASALALTAQATGWTYTTLGGQSGLPHTPAHVVAIVAAAITCFMVNSWLVAGAVGMSTGQPIGRVWKANYVWVWPGHLLGFSVAVVAAAGIGRSLLWLIPFAGASLAFTYGTFKSCVARFAEAITDPLTELPNLRYLVRHAAQELARARRDSSPLAVILIDLDGFKSINDGYGHRAGDDALRQVAQCLLQSVRTYDICARYGGDEFVAVLPGCNLEDAQRKTDALQSAVAALKCEPVAGVRVPLGVSIGVALYPEDGETLDQLLSVADSRMFQDKGRRSNRTAAAKSGSRPKGQPSEKSAEAQLREQFLQAQKMAEVGQLAGGVAHDFNNALTAILGYSDLLSVQIGPDKPMGRDIKEIASAAQHAAALTHQLLAFSRKGDTAMKPVDVNEIVCGTETMLRRLLGEQIAIRTELATGLAPITADAVKLQQVLINLAVNARDAMVGGGVLTIATHDVDQGRFVAPTHAAAKGGHFVALSVSDTGVGMTPELRARIFEPFFTTKAPGHGTGLGLAAVSSIVTQLHGFIEIDSEPGGGTTFKVYLPKTQHWSRQQLKPRPVGGVEVAPVGGETILLVEDEEGVREFVTRALRRYGYQVLTAPTAEAALTILEELPGPIDLLLTDVVLPGIDGRELASRIEHSRPDLPILFTTGYVDKLRDRDSSFDPGAQVLAKPFTARALLSKTRELLDRAPQPDAA